MNKMSSDSIIKNPDNTRNSKKRNERVIVCATDTINSSVSSSEGVLNETKKRKKQTQTGHIDRQKEASDLVTELMNLKKTESGKSEISNDIIFIQCHGSHLERFLSYIDQDYSEKLKLVGTMKAGRRNRLGLAFFRLGSRNNETEEEKPSSDRIKSGGTPIIDDLALHYASRLANTFYLKPALSQINILCSQRAFRCSSLSDCDNNNNGSNTHHVAKLIQQLTDLFTSKAGEKYCLRVIAYPPPLNKQLIDILLDHVAIQNDIDIKLSPTNFTHVLSLVQIPTSDGDFFMLGLSTRSAYFGHLNTRMINKEDEAEIQPICRAYFKLEEAVARYKITKNEKYGQNGFNSNNLLDSMKDKIALDCGCAPGGWTQFLVQNAKVKKVIAVDPSDLSPEIKNNPKVRHLQMKLEDAIPILASPDDDSDEKIDIIVSDMCLHDMQDQINLIEKAKPLLSEGALFILTLKCITGYTKTAYDFQVQNAISGLESRAFGIQTIHLFSNRSGERCVIGYLK